MSNSIIENTYVAYLGNEDSTDISNPIHSTEVAKSYGFPDALVGGVTVWGWATDTILEALGAEWLSEGWAEYSFRQPVYPEDHLIIRASLEENSNSWDVKIIKDLDTICVNGRVGIGKALWSDEFIRTSDMEPRGEESEKPPLVLEDAEPGRDWSALSVDLTNELVEEFTTSKQITDNPLFIDNNGIAHPSWTAGWAEQLLRHNFDIPSSMHTRSRVQHLQNIPIGTSVVGGAHLLEVYERKAHHFANFDVLLQDDHGNDVAQLRHWTIFRIATLEERAQQS